MINEGGIMEKLYTRKEAAAVLGISVSTLDNVRSSGQISYVQYVTNGSVFFTEEALAEYVAKCTHRALPAELRHTYRKTRRDHQR